MKEITIKSSKRKIMLLLIAGIVFIFISSWFVIQPADFVNFITRNKTNIFLVGILGNIFFGLATIMLFIKIFDNKPGLIINKDGIIDNSGPSSVGFIKWSDITKISQKKVASTKFLLIEVKNPEEYLEKANTLKRLLLKQNFNTYKTPITLTSVGLECGFEELEKLLQEEFEEYKVI